MTNQNAMDLFLNYLPRFNRKERFHLIQNALFGKGGDYLELEKNFVCRLKNCIKTRETDSLGNLLFAAIDYHLDWIHACLHLARKGLSPEKLKEDSSCPEKTGLQITGTQQDIDLLAVFEDVSKEFVHIVMIEAKGVLPWSSDQLLSKTNRFNDILQVDHLKSNDKPFAKAHYVLFSPKKPPERKLDPRLRPLLENASWLKLELPEKPFLKVTRCDQSGSSSAKGGFWKVVQE